MGDIFDQVAAPQTKSPPPKGGGDIFDQVTSAPGYTGNFKRDIGGPSKEVQRFHVPERGSEATISMMKGIAGMPGQLFAPPKTPTEMGIATTVPEVAMPLIAAKRGLIDPQVEEFKKFQQTHGVESLGHLGAAALPVLGPMAGAAGEMFRQGEPEKGAMQSLMTISGAHGAAPSVEKAIAEYSPATRKFVSDALNHYATGVGSRHFDVAPNTKTGINAGLEVARVIEPFEQMKNQEARLSAKSTEIQTKFKAKADEATKAGVVVDALPEFTEATSKLVREAKNVRPDAKIGNLPSTVEQSIAFFDKWNENGRLSRLTPNEAMVLKQDLDSIVRDPHGSVPALVKDGAEKLRTIIDQKMDKQVMRWKDYNHAASGLIEASEKAAEKTQLAAKGKLAAQLRILASLPSASEAAVMLPVIAGSYFISELMGGGMYGHIAVTTGLVSAFRALAKGMPSAATRMSFATKFADLAWKEKMSGPSTYPPAETGMVPMGGPGGSQGGGMGQGDVTGGIARPQPPQGPGPAGNLGGRQGLPASPPVGLSPQRVLELMEQAKQEVSPTPESPKQMPNMAETTKTKVSADLERQRHTVRLQVNGEMREVVLTPEKLQEWEQEKIHHESMRDMIKKNYRHDPEYMNRALKGAAMRWSARKRQITGLLTEKEKAAAKQK